VTRNRARWIAVAILLTAIPSMYLISLGGKLGIDYRLYMYAAGRWLSGGPFYEAYQLAGPYQVVAREILYPPVSLILFIPFTKLPALLWWAVPIGIIVWAIRRLDPRPWVWPILALCVAWPPTLLKAWTGNPVMWAVAALAVGVVHAGPAIFVLLKPSLFPFALWGVRQRRMWLALFVVLCIPFASMWIDFVRVLSNSRGGGILYSVQEVVPMLLPLVAWLGAEGQAPLVQRARLATMRYVPSRRVSTATGPTDPR
jgi:hypothetical protein